MPSKTRVGGLALGLALLLAITLVSQSPSLTLLSREGRRPIALSLVGDREFVGLDDLATAFQLTVREESGALTVSYKGRTIVLTGEQALASIGGRLVSLPARPVRSGSRWLVPVEFISLALASIYDVPLDLHRESRLLVLGDLRVPRVSIRHEPLGNAARLTIDATPRAASVVSQDGTRLTIRFEADALDVTPPPIQSQGFVLAVRVVDPSTLAVDLGPRFGGFRATSEGIDTTTRLVIDFMGTPTDAIPGAPASASPPSPPALPDLRPPASPITTIVLDPGHGGSEKGATGPGGTLEKDFTLAMARRLKATIEGRLGIRVILTRDDDQLMSLDDRAAVANNNKAGLFLSLHANAAPRPDVAGASIYVAAFSEQDLAGARLVPERVPLFGGGLRDIELVPWNFAQMRFIRQSAEAARLLEGSLRERVPLVTPAVASAPFRVLESANMPALLIEVGYLSNPSQEKQLANSDFQTVFSQAVVDAVTSFRDQLAAGDGAER